MPKSEAKEELENKAAGAAPKANLFGEFSFKIDAKGRLALPSKFRKVLPNDLVVSLDIQDECLHVYHPQAFNEWIEQLFIDRFGGYDESDMTHVHLRTKLKSRADGVEVDGSGRIMLNPKLREAAGLKKDVVLIGNTGYFEVWDSEAYKEAIEETDLSLLIKKPSKSPQEERPQEG